MELSYLKGHDTWLHIHSDQFDSLIVTSLKHYVTVLRGAPAAMSTEADGKIEVYLNVHARISSCLIICGYAYA